MINRSGMPVPPLLVPALAVIELEHVHAAHVFEQSGPLDALLQGLDDGGHPLDIVEYAVEMA